MSLLKNTKENKTEFIGFKVTETEYNEIKTRALLWTDGDLSKWVRYAALNFQVGKEDQKKAGPKSRQK